MLLTHIRRRKLDPRAFLNLVQISDKALEENTYSLSDLLRYCQLAVEFSGDELFPMRAGRRMQLAEFPVIGALSMHASSMKQVIEDLAFFVNKTNKGEFEINIVYNDGQGYIRFLPTTKHTDEEYAPYMDLIMAGIAYNCFIIAHDANVADLKEPEVCFRRPPPADPDRVARLFQMPVKYSHKYNQLRLDDAFLNQPLSSADQDTYKLMKQVMVKTAAVWTEDTPIVERIQTLLQSTSQPNICSIEEIAGILNISKSTLQRRLQLENTTYRDLQKSVIESRAKKLLLKSRESIQDISTALGYREIASFHRAFKRWTGMTPKEFRQSI